MNETITTQLAMPVSAANPQEHGRQNRWTVLYHWFSVFGLLIAVASILLRLAVEDKTLRIELLTIHRQAGLFVLLVLALRLGTRLKIGVRDFAPDLRRTLRVAAKVAHVGLYLLLLVLTLLGWATTNAHAVGLNLFGVLPLPNLVADDPDLADALSDYHLWAAWLLLAMVTAHVGAACWHHWWRRDRVLIAMLPRFRRKHGWGADE